jgi:3-hydroxymyristoyl/3-hydroxydecanoyl-(acyl carrier protein) dehydratase
LKNTPRAYLLIVNTHQECVVGGEAKAVKRLVALLGCTFSPLQGVTTVHCEVAAPVAEAYRELHLFRTTPPPGVVFYSGAWGTPFTVARERAADAILAQALEGIDFPRVIDAAWEDGARIFLETGPGSSCSRMIGRILEGRPHLARSACYPGQDPVSTVLRLVGQLVAERVPVNLEPLHVAEPVTVIGGGAKLVIPVGGKPFQVARPPLPARPAAPAPPASRGTGVSAEVPDPPVVPAVGIEVPTASSPMPPHPHVEAVTAAPVHRPDSSPAVGEGAPPAPAAGVSPVPVDDGLLRHLVAAQEARLSAHEAYLRFSATLAATMADNLKLQMELAGALREAGIDGETPLPAAIMELPSDAIIPAVAERHRGNTAVFDRELCREFAVGSVARMLGPDFAEADRFPTRVRLPDEPLMLVDRITALEGEPRSMTHGRVVTEHDILADSWYLDGGRIPTCIAVEAGQADLFLSGYLGIDFITRGEAVYRLLDAVVTFHRSLPGPGETIRYDIRIERFFRQDRTYLFRFSFEGTVNGEPLLTMKNGCAGFFTAAELAAGKGIVHTRLDLMTQPGIKPPGWEPPVPMGVESYDAGQLDRLRHGDLAGCFGPRFAGLPLRQPLTIPTGRMKLVDRVTSIDPTGGRFGLGMIRAEADITPDAWFLTCHFVDDRVMPGTLMYECCLHTLRIYLLRMGWIGEAESTVCEPVPEMPGQLKCRGQVVETTRTVTYEVVLKELGYRPEPYVVVDALMYADGRAIVEITGMSARLSGLTEERVLALWRGAGNAAPDGKKPALFDYERILAFAVGKPSEAFGAPYLIFDGERRIARLPGPPFQFLDRVTAITAIPWQMEAGGSVEAQYDVPIDAWYFAANRQPEMPFAVLLEAALQPCGWLAAYIGSALTSPVDLSFRNLGGTAVCHRPVTAASGTLTMIAKITRVSASGGMIIQNYDFSVADAAGLLYTGDTLFGFFSREALSRQVGIREALPYAPDLLEIARSREFPYPDEAPYPEVGFRMVDRITLFVPDGGPHGLGFIRGVKRVDPEEWFFKAHFYQDPVCPGSLGLESFLQLLKVVAAGRWGGDSRSVFVANVPGRQHGWTYRGQVVPENREVTIEAVVTAVDDAARIITADGFLSVDGRVIYQMNDFTLGMVPGCQEGGAPVDEAPEDRETVSGNTLHKDMR